MLGLLGPNGAGKTTTVRMMTTLARPTSGTARVAGHDVLREPDAVRRSMGLTGQAATVDELLTGRENLRLIGSLYGLSGCLRQGGRRRPARAVLADRGGRPHGQDLLRWHAPAARPRGQPHRHPARAVPRRAHDRARPPQPRRAVGGPARAGQGRHHAAADDPVPRGGRPARRPDRRHRPRRRSSPRARRSSSRTAAARPAWCSPCRAPRTSRRPPSMLRQRVSEVHVDEAARQLTAPAEGLRDMTRIAAVFEDSAIELDDLGLKRPSLDDVFLHLTGHRAEDVRGTEPTRSRRHDHRHHRRTSRPAASPDPRSGRPGCCASRWRSPGATSSTSSGCPRC